jgi:hypothetical protein
VLESLPARPLSETEVSALRAQHGGVMPLTYAGSDGDDEAWTVTIVVTESESERIHLLGFDDDLEGWTVLDRWQGGDTDFEEIRDRAAEWLEEAYPDSDPATPAEFD